MIFASVLILAAYTRQLVEIEKKGGRKCHTQELQIFPGVEEVWIACFFSLNTKPLGIVPLS